MLLRNAAPSPPHGFLTLCISLRTHNLTDHPISSLDTPIKTGSESLGAIKHRRRNLFAEFVVRMEDTRLSQ